MSACTLMPHAYFIPRRCIRGGHKQGNRQENDLNISNSCLFSSLCFKQLFAILLGMCYNSNHPMRAVGTLAILLPRYVTQV